LGMSSNVSSRREDQLIEAIIFTFKVSFISDINQSRDRSIAVGQLSACLLEHLSGYLFPGPVGERVARFVDIYMEQYGELGLYGLLRNSLDERLADRLGAVMTGVPGRLREDGSVRLDRKSVLETFIRDLEAAVDRALDDLLADRQMRRQALDWLQEHPVVEFKNKSLYTRHEKIMLMEYYTSLLKELPMFSGNDRFSVGFNFGDGGYLINVTIDDFAGRQETRVPLEMFIGLMGWKSPADLLREGE
jgi:hypothetical protein